MNDAEQYYVFTCPSCSGHVSILLERIPPVQARFPCPNCEAPMDFPSREQARVSGRLRSEKAETTDRRQAPRDTFSEEEGGAGFPGAKAQFRIEKAGFEADVYDRRAIRNLIRTGEVREVDGIRVDGGEPVLAGDLSYLKSLFNLRKGSTAKPPICCRTHTDRVAFFKCRESGRPLCEDCAPERKFGATALRVCNHCGQAAAVFDQA
ncbi:MAG TPA: hypothetical protein VLO07_03400 [Thermoanaerobaculia bacterium]|nr:hypothetical protein [Thermoanaerobaculia bacterium]